MLETFTPPSMNNRAARPEPSGPATRIHRRCECPNLQFEPPSQRTHSPSRTRESNPFRRPTLRVRSPAKQFAPAPTAGKEKVQSTGDISPQRQPPPVPPPPPPPHH